MTLSHLPPNFLFLRQKMVGIFFFFQKINISIFFTVSQWKKSKYLFKKKKIRAFFLSRKVKKRIKNTFRTNRYL